MEIVSSKAAFVFAVCLTAGCHDITELYVHPDCPDWVYGATEEILLDLSEHCGEDFVSRLKGKSSEVDSYRDVIVCNADLPKCSALASESGDIWISAGCDDGFILFSLKHELGHYLGARDISGTNVMHHVRNCENYTPMDYAEICGYEEDQ